MGGYNKFNVNLNINDVDFKLFYDYFTTSAIVCQVLTTSEYEIFQ